MKVIAAKIPPPEPPDDGEPEHAASGAAVKPAARKTRRPRGAPKPAAGKPAAGTDASAANKPDPPFETDGPWITNRTYARSFQHAFLLKNGKRITRMMYGEMRDERCILLWKRIKNPDGHIVWIPQIIFEGDIRVKSRHLSYKITPSRMLTAPEWHEYSHVEATDNRGRTRSADIASMDLQQQKARALWPDKLGATLTGQTNAIREFISIEALSLNTQLTIQGQGPVYLDDGSPHRNALLDKSLVFVTKSGSFDTSGETLSITADLGHIPDKGDYYDLTPKALISDNEITRGLELLSEAYDECGERYAEIPAAFIGQLVTASVVAIDPKYWSLILFTGDKGSGKSYYALRWDAIQARGDSPETARKSRGDPEALKPALNLGDTTGTAKGLKYHVVNYGGFAVTADDALKAGDSEYKIREQSEKVSALIRSYLAGGGELAKVDRSRNDVNAANAPALHSSVRVLSEIPIPGGSTLDRGITLPHIGETWDRGNIFVREISEKLSTAESRELQHRAYSAFVRWEFERLAELDECHAEAMRETETWGVPARTTKRYAALVAGHLMFKRYCESHDVDITAKVKRAIAALRECARRQSQSAVPLCEQFAKDLRAAIINHYVSYPGPPPDDIPLNPAHAGAYGEPGYWDESGREADGTPIKRRIYPEGIGNDELGLMLSNAGQNATAIPHSKSVWFGWLIPPRVDAMGRPASEPLLYKWLCAHKQENFAELCKKLSRDNKSYDPDTVMRSMQEMGVGNTTRVTIRGKQTRVWVFDAEWALTDFASNSDTGEDD